MILPWMKFRAMSALTPFASIRTIIHRDATCQLPTKSHRSDPTVSGDNRLDSGAGNQHGVGYTARTPQQSKEEDLWFETSRSASFQR